MVRFNAICGTRSLIFIILNLILSIIPRGQGLKYDPSGVHFYLHPFPNSPKNLVEIKINDPESFKTNIVPLLNPNVTTVILAHGYQARVDDVQYISKMYLSKGIPSNLILTDWAKLAGSFILPVDYIPVITKAAPIVAQRILDLIFLLESFGLTKPEMIHLIGISAGAHILAEVGTNYFSRTGKKIARISGLDPAGPFKEPPIALGTQLSPDNAEFVDVYHTNAGLYGTFVESGHVDFYVNGGKDQPGCLFIPLCDHAFALLFFAVTAKRPYVACADSSSFRWISHSSVCYAPVLAGVYTPSTVRGKYFVQSEIVEKLAIEVLFG